MKHGVKMISLAVAEQDFSTKQKKLSVNIPNSRSKSGL
jgi:hypothetical protein